MKQTTKRPYTITIDYGKPYEETAQSETELKKVLSDLYALSQTEEFAYLDLVVYNDKDEDITESQYIQGIITDIIQEIDSHNLC